jgi:hypothetical protein
MCRGWVWSHVSHCVLPVTWCINALICNDKPLQHATYTMQVVCGMKRGI